MPFRRVLAVIAFLVAGSGAGEAVSQSAPSAAGVFTGEAGRLGAQGSLGRSQDQAADGERWSSYRDFWFDYNSSRIDATDASKVTDIASYLKQNPSFRLAIDGAMPAGDADLSDRRIDSVREALIAAGVPAYKIYTGTFGDPLLRRERRVEVLFSTRD
jgi:outer membrane protein OmpA-like peptidoglycan-associated protein